MPNTVVSFDLSELSGVDPETINLTNARIDFSPYTAYEFADGEWLTRAILRVRLPDGTGTATLPPTPTGNAYEVQERGWRGARHGYVLVPDQPTVNYTDLVWVDRDTLDPTVPPSPAWVADLAAVNTRIDDLALGAADDSAVATRVESGPLTGAAVDARIASGITGKADTTALTAEATAREDADATLTTNVAANAAAIAAETSARTTADTAQDNSSRFLRAGLQIVGDMGNSIALNGTLGYYDTTQGAISYGALGYFGYALPRAGGKFRSGGVAATHGFTTGQILTTHLPTILASDWNYVHMQVLTNDISAIVAGTQTFADTQANVQSMATQILAAGKIPILATAPPVGAVVGLGATGLTLLTKMNLWVKRYAGQLRVPIADYHSALVDPATNEYITGYGNADGVHPVALGAKVMGDVLAAVLNSIPAQGRSPLWGSYNPNLMAADVTATSAGSDKWTASGNTTGGWSLKIVQSSPFHRGRSYVITRGSGGDYSRAMPTQGAWVAGNRIRVAFNLDVSNVPASGAWSAYLYNFTQSQVICGYAAMGYPLTNRSVTVTDGVTSTSSNPTQVTSASKPFRASMVGCSISASSGVTAAIPDGTTIIGVSPDGATAYMSAAATASQATSVITVTGEPCVCVWEFDVQPDMVGDDIRFNYAATGATGTSIGVSQVTIQDITALGIT